MRKHIDSHLAFWGPCNYNCYYCSPKGMRFPKPYLHDVPELRKIYATLRQHAETVITYMHAKGTEPTIHPQISEILEIAISAGYVKLLTNMSIPVRKWALSDPSRVYLIATLHPPAECDLDGFLWRLIEAREAGFYTVVQTIALPARLPIVEKLREQFREHGFQLRFNRLQGQHNGKVYPDAYSKREVGIFWPVELGLQPLLKVKPSMSPDGLCAAGWGSVYIWPRTRLARCRRDYKHEFLTEPYTSPRECGVRDCPSRKNLDKRDASGHVYETMVKHAKR